MPPGRALNHLGARHGRAVHVTSAWRRHNDRLARSNAQHWFSKKPRGGVTLFELLVVLFLMGISAALVWPAISAKPNRVLDVEAPDPAAVAQREAGQAVTLPDTVVDAVLTTARRAAIKRGEPVRLRMATDGVWAMISVKDGLAIETGRAATAPGWAVDVVVDALGTCVLSPGVVPPARAQSWDALACRWRGLQ